MKNCIGPRRPPVPAEPYHKGSREGAGSCSFNCSRLQIVHGDGDIPPQFRHRTPCLAEVPRNSGQWLRARGMFSIDQFLRSTWDPAVASATAYIGPGGSTVTENNGRMFITLKPHEQRSATADQVIM